LEAEVMGAIMGRRKFSKALLVAAILTACSFTAHSIGATSIRAADQPQATQELPYYVEFRVAVDGVYGHSYIAYGHLNALGQPATTTYADIHPTGSVPSMVLGHFFPMEAATTPEKETLGFKIASRFRRPLTVAEYRKLNSVIARIRAAGHAWSVLAYNCNDFVADVARGIGMQAPSSLLPCYDFIPKLQAMNEHIVPPVPAQTSARSTVAARRHVAVR
jgi:hypothetical protein